MGDEIFPCLMHVKIVSAIIFSYNYQQPGAAEARLIVIWRELKMLKDFVKAAEPEPEEFKKELKEAQEKLFGYQMQIKEAKLPVIVIFEGWGAAGKGSVIGRVIKSIDPRFFRVRTMASPTPEEKRYPFLYRYLREIPEAGKFTFFDTYWMNEVTTQLMEGELNEKRVQAARPQHQHR